jgi:exo-1,4-beta-D-glucosaminidase
LGASPSVRVSGYNTATQTIPGNGGGPTDPQPVVYQAEDATITSGVVESNHAGFTGRGFVNYDNAVGSAVEWTVNAAAAGPATVVLRYANGTTVNRPMTVSVNGTVVSTGLAFGGTGNWDTWQDKTITVNLVAGSNKIKTVATTANGGPNADKLTVS